MTSNANSSEVSYRARFANCTAQRDLSFTQAITFGPLFCDTLISALSCLAWYLSKREAPVYRYPASLGNERQLGIL